MDENLIIGNAKTLLADFVRKDYVAYAIQLDLLREPLLTLRTQRYKDLCKKREQYRHPKDKEYTDFDRRTMLEAAVADVQESYEVAKGLESLVCERVDLIKLLMRAE